MELIRLDINKFDINFIAGLIYETDVELFNLYFNGKENAADKIEKMIISGNNSLGHENIRVVTSEYAEVYGVLVSYSGDKSFKKDLKRYFHSLSLFDAIKFALLDLSDKMICAKLKKDDYYIAKVSVSSGSRGKGVGTYILEHAMELARQKGFKRAVLDVDMDNAGALKLYKRFGFNEFGKKQIIWFGGKIGVYHMEYELNMK